MVNHGKIYKVEFYPIYNMTFSDTVKTILRESAAIEVITGALVLSTVLGGWQWKYQCNQSKIIPLGFSEIAQIETQAKEQGKEVESQTRYLTAVNDLPMKVFESSNDSYRTVPRISWYDETLVTGDNIHKFAYELRERQDKEKREKTYEKQYLKLIDYFEVFPQIVENVEKDLNEFLMFRIAVAGVDSKFDNTWKYWREDFESLQPSIGLNMEGELETTMEMQYDYSHHNYKYNNSFGQAAHNALEDTIDRFGNLRMEKIMLANEFNTEGSEAAIVSRSDRDNKGELTEQELLKIANMWFYGATMTDNIPVALARLSSLKQLAPKWANAKDLIEQRWHKGDYERVSSRSHSGPIEYRLVQEIRQDTQKIHPLLMEVFDGINYAKQYVPILEQRINQLINIEFFNAKGNRKEVYKDIMEISRKIYRKNFKKGFDVEPFDVWPIFLFSLIGAAGGALVGKGIDLFFDKIQLFGAKTQGYGSRYNPARYFRRHRFA